MNGRGAPGAREHAGTREPNGRARYGSGRLALVDRVNARAKLVVMLVLSVAMVGAACGSDDGDPDAGAPGAATSTTRLLEEVPAPDPVTPDGVAVAALQEIFTWYPATEEPGDSVDRARKWLGPSMIRMLDTEPTGDGAPKPSLQWAEWARAGVTVEAFTFASGERPPDGADPAVRQFKIGIEQTVVRTDGRREPLPPATVIATVVQTPEGWRLDAFR